MRNGFLYVVSDQADSVLYVGLICYSTEKYCSGVINKSYRMYGFPMNYLTIRKSLCLLVVSVFSPQKKKPTSNPGVFIPVFFF